ncbi:unnamed protein product [Peronospora belbahrii]|uniref:Glucosidase 2 subunit beta n=1 Tax=Peronospora belbahrii TaxID=622444 RepID=A0AAU9LFL3_9STRA|nr:unnamed protein product [Peronospora belbahrii]CAH0513573.1 unnamed protein product [Peronospora belbahrii]
MALQRLTTSIALLSLGVTASNWHGIPLELQQKLRAASNFICDNGQQRLDLSRLNDNYCDCEDGSDEPGTSACSHTAAVFHCVNAGFFSADIPTSHVNDGVCDCCDGSDEYESGTCASHCYEMMQSVVAERKDQIEQVEKGLEDRIALVAKSQELWDEEEKKQQQLNVSIASLRVMVEQMEARNEHEERAEQEEKERLIAERKQEILIQLGLLDLTKEQLTSIIVEIGREGMSAKRDLLPIIRSERKRTADGGKELSSTPMDEQDKAFQERDDARQKETRRIQALIEEREKEKEKKAQEKAEEEEDDDETPEDIAEHVEITLEHETEAEDVNEAQDPEEEDLTLPKVETHPVDLLYDELAASERYERSQAVLTRKQLEDTKKELKEEEKKLVEAQRLMDKDYGVDNVFFGLRDKCVESDAGQYKYKVCFFGTATQDFVKLGDMEEINGSKVSDSEKSGESSSHSSEDLAATGTIVKEIKFLNGHACWNGPTRSLTVKLECGPDPMELYDIEEPSMCVYTAKLRTPAVCSEDDREQILTFIDARIAPHYIEIEVPPTL